MKASVGLDVTATVNTTPSAPTGSPTQTFCSADSPAIADLIAVGTGIQWYSSASGGIPLTNPTFLGNGNHYYASQTVDGCESTSRFDVLVTVNTTPFAPTGYASQSFCSALPATINDLVASGTAIMWYAAASGGSPLLLSDLLVNGTHYFASQTINGCESATRLEVTVTINPTPAVTDQTATICSGNAFTVTPAGVPVGTLYTWTAPVVTGGVTGGSAQATGQASISQTLTNPTITAQTATYTVTPTSGTCAGATFTVTVTVNPTNSISLTSISGTDAQTVCIGTPITDITYATTGATGQP